MARKMAPLQTKRKRFITATEVYNGDYKRSLHMATYVQELQ